MTPHQRAQKLLDAGDTNAVRAMLPSLDPADVNTSLIGIGVLTRERQFAEAHARLAPLVAANPTNNNMRFILGVMLHELGRYDEAAAELTRVILIDPGFAKAWLKLAACHLVRQYWPEALACYERAVNVDAKDAEPRIGYGTILSMFDDNLNAERQYRAALRLNPKAPEASVALGFCLLRQGRYAEGFRRFEDRWKLSASSTPFQPWVGPERDLRGKHVVVICEQGFGDSLQFARYLPWVKTAVGPAGTVALACPAGLKRLFEATFPWLIVAVQDVDPLPSHDILTALMSLPAIFDGQVCREPARYAVAHVKPSLARVGVCWHGGARETEPIAHADDKRRSIPYEQFEPIVQAAGTAVSLQQEDLPGCKDWLDTAAVVAGLDLVITVDTALAHLAASLGVETWIMLRVGGCWRWLSKGGTSAWYPTARLYRQACLSDWSDVIAEVARDVAEWKGRAACSS